MEWNFKKTIEEMNDEELRERIQSAMDWENPNQIRKIPYLGGLDSFVEYIFPELVARCPMTGIKDIYKITLRCIPNQFVPELKSLKFYFFGFETLPISHEHLLAKIYKDFKEVIMPRQLNATLVVAERGELATTVEYNPENQDFSKWTGRNKEDRYFAH